MDPEDIARYNPPRQYFKPSDAYEATARRGEALADELEAGDPSSLPHNVLSFLQEHATHVNDDKLGNLRLQIARTVLTAEETSDQYNERVAQALGQLLRQFMQTTREATVLKDANRIIIQEMWRPDPDPEPDSD